MLFCCQLVNMLLVSFNLHFPVFLLSIVTTITSHVQSTAGGQGTTPAPTTIKVVPTTPASSQSVCVNRWSDWINQNNPDVSGTGDVEKMTASELTSFCPGGTISQVECQTADGIPSYSSGEILTCTTDGGLVCSNADNFPIPCSDYQIKYECTCPGQF